MDNSLCWLSPVGPLTLRSQNGFITEISFTESSGSEETPLLQAARRQLEEYFAGKRKVFALPLAPGGTPFQQKIWQQLQKIPYGETRNYKELAAMAGNAKACRAAGMANHNNPIVIIIPCHRVIGADGSLTGYGGGLAIKQYLLELEQKCR